MPENQTAAYQATASDPDGNMLTFTIDGGADAALCSITSAGALTFKTAPDYDLPGDANGDNVYAVQLRVSDGSASAGRLSLARKCNNGVMRSAVTSPTTTTWPPAGR